MSTKYEMVSDYTKYNSYTMKDDWNNTIVYVDLYCADAKEINGKGVMKDFIFRGAYANAVVTNMISESRQESFISKEFFGETAQDDAERWASDKANSILYG